MKRFCRVHSLPFGVISTCVVTTFGIFPKPLHSFEPISYAEFFKRTLACKKLKDDTARLACYDGLTSPYLEVASKGRIGSWRIKSTKNPMDDSKTVIASSIATSSNPKNPVALIIRCESFNSSVFINWNEYVGNEDPIIKYRIGSRVATSDLWGLSTNGEATFARDSRAFLDSIVGEAKFAAQITPHRGNTITHTFDISGVEEIIEKYGNFCGD